MKKRILSILLVATFSFGLLAGCQPKPAEASKTTETKTADVKKDDTKVEEKVAEKPIEETAAELTLYTYYADKSKTLIDLALAETKKKFPNVVIEVEHRADSDGEVLKTRSAIGELPDIFESTGALTEIFTKSGDVVAYDDIMARENYKDKFTPHGLDGKASPDGKIYALSAAIPQNAVFFYNKKVFADNNLTEPKNYDEFMNVVTTLKKADIIPLALFAQQKWPGLQIYDLAVIAEGETRGISALEDKTVKATSDPFLKSAVKLQGLVDAGIIGKGAFNTNASQAFEMFKTGQSAMVFNGAWYFTDATEYGDNTGYFEYNPFADAGNEETIKYNVSGGTPSIGGYSINAKTKNIELAQLFAMELVYQREMVGSLEYADMSAAKTPPTPKTPRFEAFQKFVDLVPNYKTMSKYGWSIVDPELTVALEDQVEKLFAGSYPADKFVADLDKLISMIE